MIISDQHRFAFVHIPKCAGTSVRKGLQSIDETIGRFDHIAEHPAMGMVHYGHLTLAELAVHFPEHYAKVAAYRSVAIVRDPVERFYSAVHQRLREFKGYNQSDITTETVAREADLLARHLASTTDRLDLEFVHFNRQSDYVFHDGKRVVERVFALDRLAEAADYIATCTGIHLATDAPENQTLALRAGRLTPFVRLLRRPYAALVPLAARMRLRAALASAGLYGRVGAHEPTDAGRHLDRFLRDYYADDFKLLATARAN